MTTMARISNSPVMVMTVVQYVHQVTIPSIVQSGNVASKWAFQLHKILSEPCVFLSSVSICIMFFMYSALFPATLSNRALQNSCDFDSFSCADYGPCAYGELTTWSGNKRCKSPNGN